MDEDLVYLQQIQKDLRLKLSNNCSDCLLSIESKFEELKKLYIDELYPPKYHLLSLRDKVMYLFKCNNFNQDGSTVDELIFFINNKF